MFLELWLIVNDSFVDFIVVLIEMRREAYHELIEKCTNAVDVGPPIMTLPHKDFGTHIFW